MPLAALLTRLIGLWLLFGAMMKLFYGSPADLPLVGQDLPLDTGMIVLKVVIGIEVIAGAAALLRPSRGWLPAAMLLCVFVAITALQVVRGEESCGCFGTAVTVTPELMLGVDAGLLLLLLLARPWRLQPGRADLPWIAVAVVALAGIGLAVTIDRRATGIDYCTKPPSGAMVDLKVEDWVGRPLTETWLCPWLNEEEKIADGVIVLWKKSCEVCAEHLRNLDAEQGERDVVLILLPKEFEDETNVVDLVPSGAWVQAVELPTGYDWWITPPGHIEVKGGKIAVAAQGMDVLDLPKRPK